MSVWDNLIAKSRRLDEVASTIQGTPPLSPAQIDDFVNNYMEWYGECLSILPKDLQNEFRSKYVGVYVGAIESFIMTPLEPNGDYRLLLLRGSISNSQPCPWEYPYETCFKPNIFAQR